MQLIEVKVYTFKHEFTARDGRTTDLDLV